MIKYDMGCLGLCFIFQLKGSVFHKAFLMALPNAIIVALLHRFFHDEDHHLMTINGVDSMWVMYTSVLSLLMVFRNNQAYTRFWEGATLINQVRGEWFNAVSSLFAFCNGAEEYSDKVEVFQHTLVRLASLLYCSALQQVCDLDDDSLDVIEFQGLDSASIGFMKESNDRCEVIMQWIQRLIVEADEAQTIKIAPPILSRAFQELSRGIVNLNNARKIKDIPFPFPYAQLITSMMLVHWVTTPIIASKAITSAVAAPVVCFFVTFALWSLVFITMEIDQPFGEDANDLPIREMQKDFDRSLLFLMHHLAQTVPAYEHHLPSTDDQAKPQGLTIKTSLTVTLDKFLDCEDHDCSIADEVEHMMEVCSMASPSLRRCSKKRDSRASSRSDSTAPPSRLRAVLGRKRGSANAEKRPPHFWRGSQEPQADEETPPADEAMDGSNNTPPSDETVAAWGRRPSGRPGAVALRVSSSGATSRGGAAEPPAVPHPSLPITPAMAVHIGQHREMSVGLAEVGATVVMQSF